MMINAFRLAQNDLACSQVAEGETSSGTAAEGSAQTGQSSCRGWGPIFVLPLMAFWLTPTVRPPWACMWLLCMAIYAGCKWLTWQRTLVAGVPLWRHAAYLLAWPGLDAAAFLESSTKLRIDGRLGREWTFAVAKIAIGGCLFWLVPRMIPVEQDLLRGWVGMIGIVFLFHFGLFHLLSCVWRFVGIDARPLMDWPIAATSVSDFWGRRWNRAFRDLTHRFLFQPLTRLVGPRWGLAVGFLFSGLVHELVITVPAHGGYGGPTLFFGIQAAALLFERTSFGRRMGLGKGWIGWMFTATVLLAPARLLFPAPFVRNIILPFMNALGA